MRIGRGGAGDEPRTLIARLGFRDAELATPQHDEMMLWLDERITEVVAGLEDGAVRGRDDVDVKWEHPIATRNQHGDVTFTVGFIDLRARCGVVEDRIRRCDRIF